MKKACVLPAIGTMLCAVSVVAFAHSLEPGRLQSVVSHKVLRAQLSDVSSGMIDLSELLHNKHTFALRDPKSGRISYTGSGDFMVMDGYFYQNGKRLQGYTMATDLVANAYQLSDIHLTLTLPPRMTAHIDTIINLQSNAVIPEEPFTPYDSRSFNYAIVTSLYDSLGERHLAELFFVMKETNTWRTYVAVDSSVVSEGEVVFDSTGALKQTKGLTNIPFYPMTGAVSPQIFSFSLAGSTQFAMPDMVMQMNQDGAGPGYIAGYTVDDIGYLDAWFTNGEFVSAGKIAVLQ